MIRVINNISNSIQRQTGSFRLTEAGDLSFFLKKKVSRELCKFIHITYHQLHDQLSSYILA